MFNDFIPPYDFLGTNDQDYIQLPCNICPSRSYSFKIEGGENLIVVADTDGDFYKLTNALGAAINCFISSYRETHAMTQPQLCAMPDGKLIAKIGTLEIERFNELYDKELK